MCHCFILKVVRFLKSMSGAEDTYPLRRAGHGQTTKWIKIINDLVFDLSVNVYFDHVINL